MLTRVVALFSGLLFGLGMMMSGMVDPAKVIGFLDVAGNWDPSLAFVMGGAIMVFMPAYILIVRKMKTPVCAADFHLSKKKSIDGRLISGSVLFGLGWGIAGICPGPAVTSLSGTNPDVIVFVVSMVGGIWLGSKWTDTKENAEELKVNAAGVN
ncbi:transporter [Photobacterium proteolyticum]|uniref:Transporter n=1 Tax=Photobacterium proteolyticum TaxID=1903952 RepID=A0A1Q9GSK9_9GAMM|nr:YeeE/YedE family protein [Photobacterium proteolyticum]OLQ77695.1 transporter [Photobacterium proteolyticum]